MWGVHLCVRVMACVGKGVRVCVEVGKCACVCVVCSCACVYVLCVAGDKGVSKGALRCKDIGNVGECG